MFQLTAMRGLASLFLVGGLAGGLRNFLKVLAVVVALLSILVPLGTALAAQPTVGDDRLMAIAAKLPGFGGMYVDAATDTLYVYSVGAANGAVTEQVVAEALREDGPRASNLRLIQAKHSFAHSMNCING